MESAGVRFGRQVKSLMVGDSLQVDIEPAARAGAITAYKPVRFLGMEEAKTRRGATHVVGSLLEALAILDSLLAAVD